VYVRIFFHVHKKVSCASVDGRRERRWVQKWLCNFSLHDILCSEESKGDQSTGEVTDLEGFMLYALAALNAAATDYGAQYI
jgi:hypothetical protein